MYQLKKKIYTLLRLGHSSRWRKRSAGTVSLSPSFAVIYLKKKKIFLGQQLATLLQRQPEVFVHWLQPSEGIKYKAHKGQLPQRPWH